MQKKKRFSLFPAYCDRLLILATLGLVIFGSFMVVSAEMGSAAGDASVIITSAGRQGAYFLLGLIGMIFFTRLGAIERIRLELYWIGYFVLLGSLLICRFFPSANGAYAWIRLGPVSIQPSELAKVFMMAFGGKLLGHNSAKNNIENFKKFWICTVVYFVIILFIQKDLGSAIIFLGICYCVALVPPYKDYTKWHLGMLLGILILLSLVLLLLSPWFTTFLEKHAGHYMIGRFLASANPFAYQYDTGYHLIMGLVSFATGGWFGLGYGQSIHKYMNFPNPATDFILPVIVEELGIMGFIVILIGYGIIFYKLWRHSLDCTYTSGKMILMGTFVFLALHFVLNVGGVSGLIPLTGVPLLLISSGGSSLFATMCAIGICESEIIRYKKEKEKHAHNSREV
ncbi:MAG: FtsW/RodA/SpoVE family cell cycle protein [Erysipelotrichaceae bacterium]|nr:FtsW/RodA/SpoVE family cell cycle protein [Erysipelotrichaceae bacterium]